MRRTWKPTQLLQSGVVLLLLPFYGTKVHGHDNGTDDMGQGHGEQLLRQCSGSDASR